MRRVSRYLLSSKPVVFSEGKKGAGRSASCVVLKQDPVFQSFLIYFYLLKILDLLVLLWEEMHWR